MKFKFKKFLPMWPKTCLGVSKPTTWLAAQHKPQALALHHRLGKQAFVKENEKALKIPVLKTSV